MMRMFLFGDAGDATKFQHSSCQDVRLAPVTKQLSHFRSSGLARVLRLGVDTAIDDLGLGFPHSFDVSLWARSGEGLLSIAQVWLSAFSDRQWVTTAVIPISEEVTKKDAPS